MAILLIVAGMLITYSFTAGVRFARYVMIGKRLAAHSRPFSHQPQAPSKKILIVGDSTAVGVGVTEPSQSIAGKLGRYFASAEIVNVSRSGAKLYAIHHFLKNAPGKFDLLLIQGGANNIIYFSPLRKTLRQSEALLGQARQKASVVVWIVAGNIGSAPIWPWPLNWLYSLRTKKFLSAFAKQARENSVLFVDVYQNKSQDIFRRDTKRFYAPDKLHLTADGYEFWYQRIIEELKNKNQGHPDLVEG